MRSKVLGGLLLLLWLPGLLLAGTPKLTVYYYNRMPYYGEVDGRPDGILVDISRLVFEAAQVPYEFVNLPVKRIPEDLKAPGNACSIGWFMTREREESYRFSDEWIYQDKPFCIITRANGPFTGSPLLQTILESRLQLGLIDGFVYGDWLEANLAKYHPNSQKVSLGQDSGIMYQMLLGGRFDYMFAGIEEASYIVRNSPEYASGLSVVHVQDAPRGNLRYLMFSKGVDPAILARINAAIPAVRRGRPYRQILQAAGLGR